MAEFYDRMGFSKNIFKREMGQLEIDIIFKTHLLQYQTHNLLTIPLKTSQKNVKQAQNKIKNFYLGELRYIHYLLKKERLLLSKLRAANLKRNNFLEKAKSCQICKIKEFTKYLSESEIDELIDFEKDLRKRKIQKSFEQILKWRRCRDFVKSFEKLLFSLGVFPF